MPDKLSICRATSAGSGDQTVEGNRGDDRGKDGEEREERHSAGED